MRAAFGRVPVHDRAFSRAWEVQDALTAKGEHRSAGPADLVIAATAELSGLTLLHQDHDFDTIAVVTGQPTRWYGTGLSAGEADRVLRCGKPGASSGAPVLAGLQMPAFLITGGHDPTTSPEQRDAFARGSVPHMMREFEHAGHFVHADEPDGYTRATALTRPRGRAPD